MGLKSKFKEQNPLNKRLKMIQQQNLKDDQILLVVQRDPKCKIYPDLQKNVFIIRTSQKVIEVYNTIRKKIISLDKKFQTHALFIFTDTRILNKDMTIQQLYDKQKDNDDGFLYIFYSDMEPF